MLVDPTAPDATLGYLTLSSLSVPLDLVPENVHHVLAPYLEVPAILIGRLAVALTHQGRGIGGVLLRRALDSCLRSTSHGVVASLIVVDALHAAAGAFYARYGFQTFDDVPLFPKRMFLPMRTLRKASSTR